MGIIDDTAWCEIEVAGEQALARTVAGATMIIGLGPATGGQDLEFRGQRLLDALTPEVRVLRWGRQVHGHEVISVVSEDPSLSAAACVGTCDGLVTEEPGTGLMVWTADCVPVLLVGKGVVAAVHSGWRGTATDVIGTAVARIASEFGVAASNLEAFLGPSISGRCYQVGPEVLEALSVYGIDDREWRRGRHVDLRGFLAIRLCQLGVPAHAVDRIGPCTVSDPRLASYRRDGPKAGRQFSLIYRPATPLGTDRRPRS